MGQVLGFSHCQEYGSVASTPDSTPPCTDGGNEESELCELQTAREWSEDEGADEDDEDGLASSPSLWGTPRQHSHELTFSYIAIAEPEVVGASRHLRERRRGASRSSRTALFRTDTLETLLDSPDVEWDPQEFLTQEGQEAAAERREHERCPATADTEWTDFEGENYGQTDTSTTQLHQCQGTQERDTGFQRDENRSGFTVQTSTPSQPQSSSYPLQPISSSPVSRETISVKLLTSVQPRGALPGDLASSVAAARLNSQEQLVSEHWFSALNLAEADTVWTHIAAVDLIYWKDTERSGMVLTGLVVGLLSLFQLSIVSVLAALSLAVMCFTISVRLYYKVLYILNWGDGVHPFKSYLDLDISLSGELADKFMQKAIVTALSVVDALKRLFFVGSLLNSLKFLFLLYLVTFVGKLTNGLTLLIVSVIALFSMPLFYQRHQDQVDSIVAKVQSHYDNIADILLRLAHGGAPPPDQTPGGAKPKAQ
ncbi:reticulon-2a isoform X2 [Eucyclogobius newberryi]|uniref:reticulon-2a isoform X2 n=1 Tax=Eucyclogobius newberryi TaxID=166745 RepID=UPI003B59A462